MIRDTPEVYELIKQLQYFYSMAANVVVNLDDSGDPKPLHPSAKRRFSIFKEQLDQHIADLIDELQHAKNGVMQ